MGLIDDASCKHCSFHIEDLVHVFGECKKVREVRLILVLWFNMVYALAIPFDPQMVLFSLVDDTGLEVPTVFWLDAVWSVKKKFGQVGV